VRRVGLLIAIVLSGGVWAATAAAAPTTTDLPPAPTSVDRVAMCLAVAPAAPPVVAAGPGQTVVSFTVIRSSCAR
jgi:hypothetical protein